MAAVVLAFIMGGIAGAAICAFILIHFNRYPSPRWRQKTIMETEEIERRMEEAYQRLATRHDPITSVSSEGPWGV